MTQEEWHTLIDRLLVDGEYADKCYIKATEYINIVNQMATYYTTHDFNYATFTSSLDATNEDQIARLFFFLRWQATEYDIWKS